ncbi:hypothetical protein SAMN02910400_00607 [Lachnospiraceae bacterium C10]|nr:hypothetical protein SAMN02910400_00607 [Lachnospiraceae bacterium C10]
MTIWDYLTKGMSHDNIRKDDDGLTTLYVPKPEYEMGGTELSMWDMDLPGTKTFCNETAVVKLSDDVIDRMKKSQIRLPKGGLKKKDLPDSKRPYYMIRGKSIGQDQVKMILKEELPLLRDQQFSKNPFGRLDPDTIGEFLPKKFGGGWLWDTGENGGNMYSGIKYPEYDEFMPGWIKLAWKYPFLDMVIAYTNHEELPCYLCPVAEYYDSLLCVDRYKREGNEERAYERLMNAKYYKAVIDGTWDDGTCNNDSLVDYSWWQFPCRRELIGECSDHFKILHDYRWSCGKDRKEDFDAEYFWIVDVPQIYMDVVLTLLIKDGNIDVITGDEAKQVFKDYNERYHFADPRRYSYRAEEFFEKARIGEKILKECMEEYGMDFEKSMKKLVEMDYIKREWM